MRLACVAALLAAALAGCASPTPSAAPEPPAAAPEPPSASPEAAADAPEQPSYTVEFGLAHPQRPPKPIKIDVAGEYRHEPSGAVFPERVGEIERVRVTRYDLDGGDVGVSYRRLTANGPVVISVYVYPGPRMDPTDAPAEVLALARDKQATMLLESELADILKSYEKNREGAIVVSREPTVARSGGAEHAGTLIVMDIEDAFGTKGAKGRSLFHYFPWVARDWQVKVRTSSLREAPGAEDVERLLAAVTWPPEPR